MTASCESCGATNRSGANFCIGCAAKLPGFAPTGPSALEIIRGQEREAAMQSGRMALAPRDPFATGAASWFRLLIAGGLVAIAAFIGWYGYVTRQARVVDVPVAAAPVVLQPAFQQLSPFAPDLTRLPEVSEAARAAAARTALSLPAPDAGDASRVAPPIDSRDAVQTVERFYRALSAGDGATATGFVVPVKRIQGPLSGSAMTAFFRSLKEPLAIRSIRQVDDRVVEARYTYRASRAACEGRALLTMDSGDRAAAIRSISANC